jgi:hypothetical protein
VRINDRLVAEFVLPLDLVIGGRRELGVIVELELGKRLAYVAIVDPLGDIEFRGKPP